MYRVWNVLGWLTIAAIVPGMIYTAMGGGEDGTRSHDHASTCKTCSLCRGERSLPDVIDGDNLFVVKRVMPAAVADPTPAAEGRLLVARTGHRPAAIPAPVRGDRSRRVVPPPGT